MPEAFVIIRKKDGGIIKVNQKFLSISGFDREETIGKTIADLNFIKEERLKHGTAHDWCQHGHHGAETKRSQNLRAQ
ncbi:MAG: PAS domain-containing protein [Peptostreptococcaceae bacterium]|nr:PAS domain-containing protein [Peptostreptococcaceae bacterium]